MGDLLSAIRYPQTTPMSGYDPLPRSGLLEQLFHHLSRIWNEKLPGKIRLGRCESEFTTNPFDFIPS